MVRFCFVFWIKTGDRCAVGVKKNHLAWNYPYNIYYILRTGRDGMGGVCSSEIIGGEREKVGDIHIILLAFHLFASLVYLYIPS